MDDIPRRDLRRYLVSASEDLSLAVTLTMKQQDGPTTIDEILASQNLRHFINRFSKRAFGNASSRHGRRVSVIPVLERSYAGRWHYHLAMANPFPTLGECDLAIRECWAKTRWGYNEIDIQPLHNRVGWINYITKSRDTGGWDIENTHLVR